MLFCLIHIFHAYIYLSLTVFRMSLLTAAANITCLFRGFQTLMRFFGYYTYIYLRHISRLASDGESSQVPTICLQARS